MLSTVSKVIVGGAFTVPLTATFLELTPVEDKVILPDGVPALSPFRRTYNVVEGTLPDVWAKVNVLK